MKNNNDELYNGAVSPSQIDDDRQQQPLIPPAVDSEDPPSLCSKLALFMNDRRVVMPMMLFTIFGFACVALDETIALWAATKRRYGGLGFTTNQVKKMRG